jgi:MTH538 TIR-like domain (DUF1863)
MNLDDILAMMPPPKPAKRKVFVSYHHSNDQCWANFFSQAFSDTYDVCYDTSLDEPIRSGDPHYVNRTIREDYIVGSSVTVVLCGAETGKRKFVDWKYIRRFIMSTPFSASACLPRRRILQAGAWCQTGSTRTS